MHNLQESISLRHTIIPKLIIHIHLLHYSKYTNNQQRDFNIYKMGYVILVYTPSGTTRNTIRENIDSLYWVELIINTSSSNK